jgi:hypothetical protein
MSFYRRGFAASAPAVVCGADAEPPPSGSEIVSSDTKAAAAEATTATLTIAHSQRISVREKISLRFPGSG